MVEGKTNADATKIWITRSGKTVVANNNSEIPKHILRRLTRVIESNVTYIVESG